MKLEQSNTNTLIGGYNTQISIAADEPTVSIDFNPRPDSLIFEVKGERIEFSMKELRRLKQLLEEEFPEDYI